ncbi:MAG: radical SAM protein [Euryarchaeota archaeon]|nr:radical SAM protein [Euryarchaeota archaeon]MCG2737089.1 radical SAM protein [Candidatus Methanoperedenaceae archaeon]
MPSNKFPQLVSGQILRELESPVVYDIIKDELYELDDEAFQFLKKCNGINPFADMLVNGKSDENIDFMLDEGIIQMTDGKKIKKVKAPHSPIPSLRYLLLNITNECNLSCKHCYLQDPKKLEIDPDVFEKAVSQFEEMGGLKLMISGGEPLIHSRFWELMEILRSYELRVILLSNGTLIDRTTARKLSGYVHEVQVSIDGICSHDVLRGKGSYSRSMKGISNLNESGIPVSIATMVHKFNKDEFEEMEKLFSKMGAISWSVDVPCIVGELNENRDFVLDLKEAASFLKYGFGAGAHESHGDHTCGSHLCSVAPDGSVSKCGFFENEPAGDVNDLISAWQNIYKSYLWKLDELECKDCAVLSDCKGGCRFRARQYKGILAPDPLMCHANLPDSFI